MILASGKMAGIRRNVLLNRLELLWRPNEVIKTLLLPETPGLLQRLIDLAGRELLPRIPLVQNICTANQAHEQMDVIGHYDEISHVIPIAIEVQKTSVRNVTK